MIHKDKFYELIAKELTSEVNEDEKIILSNELNKNTESKQKFKVLREFWTNFYPKSKSHNIIQHTEQKLGWEKTSTQ
jgi:sulfur relay (sulfurtransferase) DsrC/TusE family protein